MNLTSQLYFEKLLASDLWDKVKKLSINLQGRHDELERLADYLEDILPSVLNVNTSAEAYFPYDADGRLSFVDISKKILK